MAIPNEARSIVITGFMGTGKTTVARLVAQKLGRPLIDTDEVIMQRAGMSISDIFAQQGEPAFRALEAGVCAEYAAQTGLVLATGGGMLVSPHNREVMLRSAIVVCLDAEPDTIELRLRGSVGRPLAGQWRELYEARRPAYNALPYHVWTDNRPIAEVADVVLRLVAGVIPVESPEGRYDIVIWPGLLKALKEEGEHFGLHGRVALVTNTTLAPLYGARVRDALPDAALLTMADGEAFKNLETVGSLYRQMVEAGLDRWSTVLALGGGVVGDTAGFAAATYMRGIRLVQVPTTLLSMVDSSVGGKVGVDLPEGKNLIGAFKQPSRVLMDPDTLKTLPLREIRAGMAEVIKHGLIGDPGLLADVSALPWDEQGNANEPPTEGMVAGIARLLARAIQVKIAVVQRDPFEKHERMHLNFGHTFGHAIEQTSGYAWAHGMAVGLGLIAAARLSERLGRCGREVVEQTEAITRQAGLPQALGDLDPEAVMAAMASDKKWQAGASRFVLLEAIGRPVVAHEVPMEDIAAVLNGLRGEG